MRFSVKLAVGFAVVLAIAIWISFLLIKPMIAPGAPNWTTGVPPAERQTKSRLALPPECRFDDLPEAFEYDAVGVYQGKKVSAWPNTDADARLREQDFVGAVSVQVTVTERPVVLLLTSYLPAIWTIKAAPGAVIAGIAYSGYSPAAVLGDVPSSTKVIDLTRDGACGGEYSVAAYEGSNFRKLQALAIAVAGAKLSTIQGKYDNDSFIVGPGAQHISDLAAIRADLHSDFAWIRADLRKHGLPPNHPKIQPLIDAGVIREATADDVFAWETLDPELTEYGLVRQPQFTQFRISRAYLILKPFVFPEKMNDAGLTTFILPAGMAMPSGEARGSTVLLMDWSGECIELMGGSVCTKR